MDIKQAILIIEQIRYKPGWTLTVQGDGWGALLLRVSFQADDSTAPLMGWQTVEVTGVSSLSMVELGVMTEPEQLQAWVLSRLITMEIHESREWFKIGLSEPSQWAPFFPHSKDGNDRWAKQRPWVGYV